MIRTKLQCSIISTYPCTANKRTARGFRPIDSICSTYYYYYRSNDLFQTVRRVVVVGRSYSLAEIVHYYARNGFLITQRHLTYFRRRLKIPRILYYTILYFTILPAARIGSNA